MLFPAHRGTWFAVLALIVGIFVLAAGPSWGAMEPQKPQTYPYSLSDGTTIDLPVEWVARDVAHLPPPCSSLPPQPHSRSSRSTASRTPATIQSCMLPYPVIHSLDVMSDGLTQKCISPGRAAAGRSHIFSTSSSHRHCNASKGLPRSTNARVCPMYPPEGLHCSVLRDSWIPHNPNDPAIHVTLKLPEQSLESVDVALCKSLQQPYLLLSILSYCIAAVFVTFSCLLVLRR
jgi:hypothetical protein